jgi:hypothetical protein
MSQNYTTDVFKSITHLAVERMGINFTPAESYSLMLRTVPKVWAESKPKLREPSGRSA